LSPVLKLVCTDALASCRNPAADVGKVASLPWVGEIFNPHA
jgi:hypothetical protein